MTETDKSEYSIGICYKCRGHGGLKICPECRMGFCADCSDGHICDGAFRFFTDIFNGKADNFNDAKGL